jgi:transposase InsO family protein
VILAVIERAQQHCPDRSLPASLADLGLPRATYYRWQQRTQTDQLTDRVIIPRRTALPPTPTEVETVCAFAREHPLLGYKRLTYALIAENKACLRPWMVRDLLAGAQLLGQRQPPPVLLHRPPEAAHSDQRWHTDLTQWWFGGRWFWVCDVLDAYSRYLIQAEVLLTARTEDVLRVVQQALESLAGRPRLTGEPELVHDGGPQFISTEWRTYLGLQSMTDVRIHPYHPQSNGRDERLHRTFREEMPLDDADTLYQAQEVLNHYRTYYNDHRPHSALRYLCPIDYYRGDPAARLAEREAKLKAAAHARRAYWQAQPR